ncbi:hypothetical protein D1B17_10100 [Companilactobacillus zhachilii]|uniref:WxL domain-containing protein n=1 Tax=Companilactobacillus zhachilii TaxID=2304606 RepID=A0A386PWM0_9LACO|nr:WxL domain-containing protein [Companilactobacillus zhachilii]AYE38960.1 hypothetical protein D1B17_10100 [Companilactobacillus zhachilii]
MKLSRNVLVGSLAVSGMVLGALAPAVTAQAAKTSGVVDSTTGEVSQTKDASGMENAGQLGNTDSKLAIAYTNADNSVTGPAAAYSNASVNVVSGVLILDQVPDFNFGTAASGSVKGLVDNSKGSQNTSNTTATDGTAAVDGNDKGALQVIESRNALSGFTVSASLGSFQDAKGNAVVGSNDAKDPFILNLNPANMTLNGKDYMNSTTPFQTAKANIATTDKEAAPVMAVAEGQTGYTTGTYAADLNTGDLVSLSVPSGINAGEQKVQSLNSTITWTLAATPKTGAGTDTGTGN